VSDHPVARVEILSVTDDGLGHSSYVVGLGDDTALVIDPARLPDEQRRLARERGWTIAWTADTHSHADYISGSTDLAADGVEFLASQAANLAPAHRPIRPDDRIELAEGVALRAIATPGHTPDHLAFLLLEDDQPIGLFSGGSLMVGAVGRTDLMGAERADELARSLYRSLREDVLTLPDDLLVYPTHGAGSFCSAPQGSARTTTIGTERAGNPLLRITDESEFVARLLADLGSFPTYFRQLPEINRLGPKRYERIPHLARLRAVEAKAHIDDGAVLVDVRPIADFADAHPVGALSNALRPVFGSWLGWLVPLDTPLVFVCDDRTDREDLVRQCLTVGHEHLLGEVANGVAAWTDAGLPVATLPLVEPADIAGQVLDVRQSSEWAAGHLPGATHVELAEVGASPLPRGPITAMCGHGERAMTAGSILQANGREVTVLAGGPEDWTSTTGQPLVTP
jgi:hydroxyacylglutathione hydrolase